MKKKKGTFLISIGLLLLAAALCLTGYNIFEAKSAEKASSDALEAILDGIAEQEETNAYEGDVEYPEYEEIPFYERFPEKEMPTVEIDGYRYAGILEIPALELRLPVMGGQWSYPKLRKAPGLYGGSVYRDNMVVAAHNYSSHFGRLKNLDMGSEIFFTDVEGNIFYFTAAWMDVLQPTEVDVLMDASDWDLTLFTCTYGGRERYALRCIKLQ